MVTTLTQKPVLLWFQIGDLRLGDNPALAAAAHHGSMIPFFAWTPSEDELWAPGAASRLWLHHSLQRLNDSLEERGSRLIIRSGSSSEAVVTRLIAETGASVLYFNSSYTRGERSRQAAVQRLPLRTEHFNARFLVDPSADPRGGRAPLRVFSAYWRAAQPCIEAYTAEAVPARLGGPPAWPNSELIKSLNLLPTPDWAGGLRATWHPGEAAAQKTLHEFLETTLSHYATERNLPDLDTTSRLSPYLHFGEISPRQVWSALQDRLAAAEPESACARSIGAFQRELGWREFAAYLLFHLPDLSEDSLDRSFDAIEWCADPSGVRAWERGATGYPLVDAGMRQLWQTGWMHNRVRMVVASFLVKDLLQPWQAGARWFWDTLVDADLANNTLGWQWTAGSGPDAAPFTRVFNPTLQAERFDPRGTYIRRYVPELARLPDAYILQPWAAPPLALAEAGVTLGKTYPYPIVDHVAARVRALSAFAARRGRPIPSKVAAVHKQIANM